MKGYIAKKIAYSILILFTIATFNFMIFQVLSPLDPTKMMIDPRWGVEEREMLRKLWGLDKPISERYINYLKNMFTFKFGRSFLSQELVMNDIGYRLPNTLLLLGTSFIFTVLIGVSLGILAASRRGGKVDVLTIGAGLYTWSSPSFFLQLIFLLIFCGYLRWFPFGGMYPPGKPPQGLEYILTVAHHLVLPVSTLVLSRFGSWAFYTRNMMLDCLTQDFIVTARAKGLKERMILFGHAFRAMLPPIFTMVALNIPGLITGSIITEYVFTWPGIGHWFFSSMLSGDYPSVQGLLFIFSILMIGANFAADLIYGYLDPRIRVGDRR